MNGKNIEKPRLQYVGNCWAIALASLIGDKFSISNNIKPIYPSSIWITSMHRNICDKEDEKNIEYKMIDMQHYLVYLKKKCQQNDISNRNLSVIFLSNEKVLEKLNNPNMTLEEQLNHDIETLKQIIQRILGIQTYIEKKQLEQEGGTKKNKKRQRKSRKKNKVLN